MKKKLYVYFSFACVFALGLFPSCRSLEETPAALPLPVIMCTPTLLPAPVISCLPETFSPDALPLEGFQASAFELRVFELTNHQRRIHGLLPLQWHDAASCAARGHSMDMHRYDLMRHSSSDGSNARQRLERSGISNLRSWSTNIAGGWSTPEEVVAAWMQSPHYRQNIIRRDFTHIGIGFVPRPQGSNSRFPTYWTAKFFVFE